MEQSRPWLVPFAATLVVMMALQMGNLGFSPILPSMQRDLAMSFTQLGLFTGLYGLVALATSVPAGMTAARFGEKPTLLAGAGVLVVGLLMLSQASTVIEGLTSRGVWIVGYRFAFISVLVAVAVTCPPTLKGRSMGIVGAVSSLASIIASPSGGAITREFGWRTAVIGYALVTVLAGIVFTIWYRSLERVTGVTTSVHSIDTGGESAGSKSAFRIPLVWALALVVGLGGVGQFSVTFFVPSVARDVFGLDPVAAGLIISTGYLGAIVANLAIGTLMDRYDKRVILLSIFSIHILASLAMTVPNLLVFRIATALVLALGFSAVNQLYGIAGEVLRGRQAGNVIGVVSLGAGVFGYVGPQLFGLLRDWTGGFRAGFFAVAAADLITLVLLLLIYPRGSGRAARH